MSGHSEKCHDVGRQPGLDGAALVAGAPYDSSNVTPCAGVGRLEQPG